MPFYLLKRLLKKLRNKPRRKTPAPPHYLTLERHSLTPATSQENLTELENYQLASAFFRLPAEIRRQILIEAFGSRPVHVELRLVGPHVKCSNHQPWWPALCARCRDYARLPRDFYATQTWEWWSRVCHRDWIHEPSRGRWKRLPVPLSYDLCLYHRSSMRNSYLWPKEEPARCLLGCLGWLQACRRSYTEGINVLYTTNMFVVDGKDPAVLMGLTVGDGKYTTFLRGLIVGDEGRSFWLPQRLASIRFLELSLDFRIAPYKEPERESGYEKRGYNELLSHIPGSCPQLKQLQIGFKECDYKPSIDLGVWLEYIYAELFGPIEHLVEAMGDGFELTVDVRDCFYEALMTRAMEKGYELGTGHNCYPYKYWQPISQLHDKQNDAGNEQARMGFWVSRGVIGDVFSNVTEEERHRFIESSVLF